MNYLLRNGLVYLQGKFRPADLVVSEGMIREIREVKTGGMANGRPVTGGSQAEEECPAQPYQIIDFGGARVVPGFIDVHTHGAVGVDVNGADAAGYEQICRFFAARGTTAWLGSVLTDTREQTLRSIAAYQQWQEVEHQGAKLLGLHLEGPFLAAEYKGAMPEHLLQKGDWQLVREYQEAARDAIRYITVSPEVEGCMEMIPRLRQMGMTVAIGHTGADYECVMAAVRAGATGATHTGNAMRLLHQHEPAAWGAVMEADEVYCEIICDGLHLHPGTVRLVIKTKGLNRVVLVTDSIMAAGQPDGNYKLGVNDVVVADGDAKLRDGGGRAGSTLTMDRALKNVLAFTGLTLEAVIPMLTENPARLIGVDDRMGTLAVGKEANLVILNEQYEVMRTFVSGKVCYER